MNQPDEKGSRLRQPRPSRLRRRTRPAGRLVVRPQTAKQRRQTTEPRCLNQFRAQSSTRMKRKKKKKKWMRFQLQADIATV